REALAAAEILEQDYGVPADVFSVTSYSELRREALAVERGNILNTDPPRVPDVRQCLGQRSGPLIAASEYVETGPDQNSPRGAGPDSPVGSGALHRARHGWLRAQRFTCTAASAFRSGSRLHRAGSAARPGRREQARHGDGASVHAEIQSRSEQAEPGDRMIHH